VTRPDTCRLLRPCCLTWFKHQHYIFDFVRISIFILMDFSSALRRSLLALERRPVSRLSRSSCALLHTSYPRAANPVSFPTRAEPPPPPPEPATLSPDDRLGRKRKQAELLQKSRELRANPSRPATVLQKRFWKDVSVIETPGMALNAGNAFYIC
jgi:hypothetical protein